MLRTGWDFAQDAIHDESSSREGDRSFDLWSKSKPFDLAQDGAWGRITGFILGHAQQVVVDKALVFVKDASKAQGVTPLVLPVLKYVETWRLRC